MANLQVSGNAMVKASNITTIKDGTGSPPELKPAASGSDGTGGIVWNDKEGTVYGNVTLQEDLEIKSSETIKIPDGSSLNCNGKLTNEGTIFVESGGELEGTPTGNGTLKIAPTITTHPKNVEVKENETATFTVNATGSDLSYRWQQSTNNGSDWANIDSETSDTYTTAKTRMGMSGTQYRCVVKNSIGEVTSDAATLTVTAIPTYTITVQTNGHGTASATPTSAKAGDQITLTATPNSGYRFSG